MITLLTGLPGNCKTLYTIGFVKAWAERENRPVFYSGIPELKIDSWTEIDPEKWYDCPPNSIIIIDECQRVFRPRAATKEPPKHVTELETHRHKGLDLWFITQHPNLADVAVRRLTGRHFHAVRVWGREKSTVHEWAGVRENCDKAAGRKDSIKHAYKFDKSIYGLYKSAEVHTVKRSIPARVFFLLALPFLLIAAVWFVYSLMVKKEPPPNAVSGSINQAQKLGLSSSSSEPSHSGRASYTNALSDARQYVYERQPRLVGFPHTAPRYDEITRPVVAPEPAACVSTKEVCKCFTQQATLLDVSAELCRDIVARGYFKDWGEKEDAQDSRDRKEYRSSDAVPVGRGDFASDTYAHAGNSSR